MDREWGKRKEGKRREKKRKKQTKKALEQVDRAEAKVGRIPASRKCAGD